MRFIDSHCHLHHRKFNKDRNQLLEQIGESGISAFIEVPIGLRSNSDMREKIALPQVYFAAGVHPLKVEDLEAPGAWEQVRKFAEMENTVAVGETGLDDRTLRRELQEECFKQFIELALELDKPLILHLRGDGAYGRALKILKERQRRYKGVLHCFHGDIQEAEPFLELGFCLGIGGLVTYEEEEKLRAAVAQIPLEKILLETDSPFLKPEACVEDKRNTPLNISVIAEEIAGIKGIAVGRVAEETVLNTKRVFGI